MAFENYGADAEGKLDKNEVIKMSKKKVHKVKFLCLKFCSRCL